MSLFDSIAKIMRKVFHVISIVVTFQKAN